MNITTKCSTLKLLFFSFSSCLTIERSIVFKTMDRQYESVSRIFNSSTVLDKSFIFIRNTRTSSSIYENSEIFKKILNFEIFIKLKNFKNFIIFIRLVVTMYINIEVYFLKRIKLLWMTGNSIKMSMRKYSDL